MQRPWTLSLGLASGVLFSTLGATAAESLDPGLWQAIRRNDVAAVKGALEKGASLEGRDADGNTPLILSAVYGGVPLLQLLVERGADVRATNQAGSTALIRGAADAAKVRVLTARGADVNARNAFGATPLMVAARTAEGTPALTVLLNRGAAVNTTNIQGGTALMAAAASGNPANVELLLKHQADPNAQPGVGPVDFIFGGARSPLMWAAFRGELPMLKRLVAAGAAVNAEGSLGTPLSQAAWADRVDAARFLMSKGANPQQVNHMEGFTPLHWAASSERPSSALVDLLLKGGANPSVEGGQPVDAFMEVGQTPLMLARRRGDTAIARALARAGGSPGTPDRAVEPAFGGRDVAAIPDATLTREAVHRAVPLLQRTAIQSKQAYLNHASRQDCTSCHQQFLPLGALGLARSRGVAVDETVVRDVATMVRVGELKAPESDWAPVFHPDPAFTKGYALLGYAMAGLPADAYTDASVNHLAAIQGREGNWYNNLPRPPMQTDDIGATSLAIHALSRYGLPGRAAEFATRVDRARRWLWLQTPVNHEGRVSQLLGLAWAGEAPGKLRGLAEALVKEQRADGGWAQLPGLESDAYATSRALHALRVAAGRSAQSPAVLNATRYLLRTQLADGSWHVRRRAFPFQPTMNSGFPHGRDSWISASATSWAVMALSVSETTAMVRR